MKFKRITSPQSRVKKLDIQINKIGYFRPEQTFANFEVNTGLISPKSLLSDNKKSQRPRTAVK